jgi:hypothetical protein
MLINDNRRSRPGEGTALCREKETFEKNIFKIRTAAGALDI